MKYFEAKVTDDDDERVSDKYSANSTELNPRCVMSFMRSFVCRGFPRKRRYLTWVLTTALIQT